METIKKPRRKRVSLRYRPLFLFFVNLLLYLLLLYQLQLLAMLSMYYIPLYHPQIILLFFEIPLLHFVLLSQKYHLVHLYYIPMYLNHLVQLVHNYLDFPSLIVDIHLYYKLDFQIVYQNVPMSALKKLVLHMSIHLNYSHYSKELFFVQLIKFAQHQMLHLHNVVIVSTQLNHF